MNISGTRVLLMLMLASLVVISGAPTDMGIGKALAVCSLTGIKIACAQLSGFLVLWTGVI